MYQTLYIIYQIFTTTQRRKYYYPHFRLKKKKKGGFSEFINMLKVTIARWLIQNSNLENPNCNH